MITFETFYLDVCGPGTFISDGECQECPLGYYQNMIDQASCIPCPSIFMSTEETGSSYESDCYLAYESVDGNAIRFFFHFDI